MERLGDLELEQDLPHQERMWRVQKVVWILLTLALVAGLVGLFGSGPLSAAKATGGGLDLDYQRFLRREAPTSLKVNVRGSPSEERILRLTLSREYLEGFMAEDILPQPLSTEAGARNYVFEFKLAEPGSPTTVCFHLKAKKTGLLDAEVAVEGHSPVAFRQFVYP
ncbi:MAG: hypothetical protein HY900_10380 [Deltaproteobacteria bacterium]|nr:hypothetical protein [Deltaproteobacteria bacterium]